MPLALRTISHAHLGGRRPALLWCNRELRPQQVPRGQPVCGELLPQRQPRELLHRLLLVLLLPLWHLQVRHAGRTATSRRTRLRRSRHTATSQCARLRIKEPNSNASTQAGELCFFLRTNIGFSTPTAATCGPAMPHVPTHLSIEARCALLCQIAAARAAAQLLQRGCSAAAARRSCLSKGRSQGGENCKKAAAWLCCTVCLAPDCNAWLAHSAAGRVQTGT